MAHTVEDKILELADKYTTDGTDGNYRRNKEMLLEFAKALGIDTGDATYHIESLVRKSPASEDLEKELKYYCNDYYNCDYPKQIEEGNCSEVMPHIVSAAKHFAQWQKDMMMKGAVDGEVNIWGSHISLPRVLPSEFSKQRVKVIIIKE